jgi:hypothetical protein
MLTCHQQWSTLGVMEWHRAAGTSGLRRREQLRRAKRKQRAQEKKLGLRTVQVRVPASCSAALRAASRLPAFPALVERFLEEHTVELEHAPVLRDLLWTGRVPERIASAEAFRIYERHWPYVRRARLGDKERELIERLARQHGDGLING